MKHQGLFLLCEQAYLQLLILFDAIRHIGLLLCINVLAPALIWMNRNLRHILKALEIIMVLPDVVIDWFDIVIDWFDVDIDYAWLLALFIERQDLSMILLLKILSEPMILLVLLDCWCILLVLILPKYLIEFCHHTSDFPSFIKPRVYLAFLVPSIISDWFTYLYSRRALVSWGGGVSMPYYIGPHLPWWLTEMFYSLF